MTKEVNQSQSGLEKTVNYPNLFSTQKTYNYRQFNSILESVPDIWTEVTVNYFGEIQNLPLAVNVAQHIRRIDPHGLWSNFLEKIEQDISKYPVEEKIQLLTKLVVEVDDYPVNHFSFDKVIDRILGRSVTSELYFSNMKDLTFGFDSVVVVAICNATTERRNQLLVEKMKIKDYASVKTILDTTRVQPSDLRTIKISDLSLIDYLQKELVEYKEEIVKVEPIKDIDKLFKYQLNTHRIGENLHREIMNYHCLEKILEKVSVEMNQEDRALYKKKM